ncbi:MAG TPA: response regulator transcription factor [Flavitalea sp.]|nr:response regulator transcription factor [Flavitalea sp.]
MKVLVIEDEKTLSESICAYLAGEQFVTEFAYDAAAGMEKIELYDYACIVLDISLPDGTGMEILQALKDNKKEDGVIIISAKSSLDDKLMGLKEGADDYLAKPFHLSELAARVAAIIRRKTFGGQNVLVFDQLQIDLNKRILAIKGKEVDLTKKEYELLLYFLGNKNRVVSKNALATHLWGDDMDMVGNYDFIYTHIKNLKRKLIQAGSPDYFKSVYGVGYKFSWA